MPDSDHPESPHKPGPNTDEGKAKVRLNAFKHGITCQVINMPPEIAADYMTFNKSMLHDLQPKGFLETQIARPSAIASGVSTAAAPGK